MFLYVHVCVCVCVCVGTFGPIPFGSVRGPLCTADYITRGGGGGGGRQTCDAAGRVTWGVTLGIWLRPAESLRGT